MIRFVISILFFTIVSNHQLFAQVHAWELLNKAQLFLEDRKFEEATEILQQIKPPFSDTIEAEIQLKRGIMYSEVGKYTEAINSYKVALQIFKKHKNAQRTNRCYYFLSYSYEFNNMYKEAIEVGKLAVPYYRSIKDTLKEFGLRTNIALSMYRSAQVQEALEYYIEAANYLGNNYPLSKAIVYNQLGTIWSDDFNDHQKALEYYFKAIELREKNNSPKTGLAAVYNNIGLEYKNLKDTTKAIFYYNKAFILAKEANNAGLMLNPLVNLGNINKAYNKYSNALHFYKQATTLLPKVSVRQQINVLSNIAFLNNELQQYDSAIYYAQKTLAIAEKSNDIKGIIKMQEALFTAYSGKKEYKTAYETLLQFTNTKDSIQANQSKTEIANLLVKYQTAEKDKQLLMAQQAVAEKEREKKLLAIEKDLALKESYALLQESKLKEQLAVNDKNQSIIQLQKDSLKRTTTILQQERIIKKNDVLLQNNQSMLRQQVYTMVGLTIALLFTAVIVYYQLQQRKNLKVQNALQLQLSQQAAANQLQQERLRISKELHDNIGSHLTLINATVEQMPFISAENIASQISTVKNSLLTGMRELRRTVWLINNTSVTLEELAIKLRDYFKPAMHENLFIQIQVEKEAEQPLNELATTHIFRIMQEAVNNSIKYAQCSIIQITITAENGLCTFYITDNGQGFDTTTVAFGNGIQNMQHRIKELNGKLAITSKLQKGTQIEGIFPLV